MSAIVLPRDITASRVERIYEEAKRRGEKPYDNASWLAAGWRVAQAAAAGKEPRFVYALEKCAEVLDRMSEEQMGQTRRQSTELRERWSHTRLPTVVQVFREAYKGVDSGKPEQALSYLYAAVAQFAGYIV